MLADLEARKADLQGTLLRISGALQVLQEILADESPSGEAEIDQLADTTALSVTAEPEASDGVVSAR